MESPIYDRIKAIWGSTVKIIITSFFYYYSQKKEGADGQGKAKARPTSTGGLLPPPPGSSMSKISPPPAPSQNSSPIHHVNANANNWGDFTSAAPTSQTPRYVMYPLIIGNSVSE